MQLFQQYLPVFVAQIEDGLTKMDKKVVKLYLKQLAASLKAMNETNDFQREFLNDAQINAMGPLIKRTLDLVTALRMATKKVIL